MDENRFWSLIESAWESVGGAADIRSKLAEHKFSEEHSDELEQLLAYLNRVVPALTALLDKLPAEELLSFDRILERKLYDIDRAEVQEQTDGSDDGFLYARGFIVIAGKTYYDAVNAVPTNAYMDMECEEMCYISWHLHKKKFGKPLPSGISRESCQNKNGWPA
jgi:hypothetical protein